MSNIFIVDPWNPSNFPLNFAFHSTHLSPFLCFSTWRYKIIMWHFIILHKNLLNQIYKWVKCTFYFSSFSYWKSFSCQLLSSYAMWGTFAPNSKRVTPLLYLASPVVSWAPFQLCCLTASKPRMQAQITAVKHTNSSTSHLSLNYSKIQC